MSTKFLFSLFSLVTKLDFFYNNAYNNIKGTLFRIILRIGGVGSELNEVNHSDCSG